MPNYCFLFNFWLISSLVLRGRLNYPSAFR